MSPKEEECEIESSYQMLIPPMKLYEGVEEMVDLPAEALRPARGGEGGLHVFADRNGTAVVVYLHASCSRRQAGKAQIAD